MRASRLPLRLQPVGAVLRGQQLAREREALLHAPLRAARHADQRLHRREDAAAAETTTGAATAAGAAGAAAGAVGGVGGGEEQVGGD
eukprot:3805575-Prymnesium_polylepis.1